MEQLKYYLDCGVECEWIAFDGVERVVLHDLMDFKMLTNIRDGSTKYKPLMRPLSYLTKEITVEGYNGGKPFVPIEEIRIMAGEGCSDEISHLYMVSEGRLNVDWLPYWMVIQLVEWGIWIGDQTLFGKSIIEIKE